MCCAASQLMVIQSKRKPRRSFSFGKALRRISFSRSLSFGRRREQEKTDGAAEGTLNADAPAADLDSPRPSPSTSRSTPPQSPITSTIDGLGLPEDDMLTSPPPPPARKIRAP